MSVFVKFEFGCLENDKDDKNGHFLSKLTPESQKRASKVEKHVLVTFGLRNG